MVGIARVILVVKYVVPTFPTVMTRQGLYLLRTNKKARKQENLDPAPIVLKIAQFNENGLSVIHNLTTYSLSVSLNISSWQ